MKYILKPTVTLLIIAVAVAGLLGAVYSLTREPAERQLMKTREAVKSEVLPGAVSFVEIFGEFSENILSVYEAYNDGGSHAGYVIELLAEGYGGPISLMAGFSAGSISGVRIMRHSETPGLGALITSENFYKQYEGKKIAPLTVVRSGALENEIDAITGATISARAVTNAVNEGVEWVAGN